MASSETPESIRSAIGSIGSGIISEISYKSEISMMEDLQCSRIQNNPGQHLPQIEGELHDHPFLLHLHRGYKMSDGSKAGFILEADVVTET